MSAKVDLKVVLLGKECVGKTSLMERFVNNRFVHFSDRNPYQATIGAAFAAKKLFVSESRALVLGVWDTAGSERYESMSRQYYRNARAAIVCFDVCDPSSVDRALFWALEVLRTEELCRIYLCRTKTDITEADPTEQRVSSRDIDRLAKTIHTAYESEIFVAKTSAKTGVGVQELFTRIAKDFVDFAMDMSEDKSPIGLSHSKSNSRTFCCF